MKKSKLTKTMSLIMLILILFSSIQPVLAASGSGTWSGGQYASKMFTTDNQNTSNGVIIRRLNNLNTGEKRTVFCAEHGVEFATGTSYNGVYYTPTDSTIRRACKIAYLGWYKNNGGYTVDGGILASDMIWVKWDYVFTQQYIWETLGQSNATFINADEQAGYVDFKNRINNEINELDRRPSFNGQTISIDAGDTKNFNDSNGVLADYESMDQTVNGIRIQHTKGSNTLTISVDENTNLENYRFSDNDFKSWGMIKGGTEDDDSMVYFEFQSGVQNQLYCMNYNDPVTLNFELKIDLLGNLELQKLSDYGTLIDGAVYNVKGPNNYNNDVTVQNGKILLEKLRKGTYTVTEKNAPNGYLLDSKSYNVEVKSNQTSTQEIKNSEPTGTISIIKKDSETGGIAQGDATLKGAVYKIYADGDIYSKDGTKKFYNNKDLVATRTMNEKGETEDITNLPLGNYIIKEDVASKGYLLDKNEYKAELKYVNQNTPIIVNKITSNEDVKKMNVHIFKSGIKVNSGLVNGIEGAEFTIKLQSSVEKALNSGYSYAEIWNGIDEEGNKVAVNEKRVKEAQVIAPSYESITTNTEGNAYTQKALPYGKYIVKETKTPNDFETAIDFSFSITKDESEVNNLAQKIINLNVNDEQLETYIKLIKKDLKTDKIVTLSSTTFQIKASEDIIDRGTNKIVYKKGDTISQKIGNTIYDTFTTNADNNIVPSNSYNTSNDEKGTVVTPLTLAVGKYEISEINIPRGFLQLDESVKFEIRNIKDFDTDKDGDFIKEIVIKNEQPTGAIKINKKIAVNENVDTSLINIEDLSGIEFKLYAKEDIIDNSDGSVIFKKGQEVGIYNLTKEGKLEIKDLPLGDYEIQETKTLDGLVLNNEKTEVKFEKKDNETKVYTEERNIENKATLIDISKTDITGDKELVGATLSVIDEKGNLVDTWISSEKTHKIEGLLVGKEYILREEITPDGFVQASDVKFIINNSNDIQKVVMIDKVLSISKVDISGEEIEGATLILTNTKTKNIVDKWTSTKETHIVNGLIEGETYNLHEEIVAEGYVKASDIQFLVTFDKETQKIEMIDKVVEIVKTDIATGEEIEGAELKVIDENGTTIDTWISTKEPHKVVGLEEGKKYTLVEVTAPFGYEMTESIDFEVTEDKETQRIEMKDKAIIETPKTGDNSHVKLVAGIAILSLLGIAYVGIKTYKSHKNNKDNK